MAKTIIQHRKHIYVSQPCRWGYFSILSIKWWRSWITTLSIISAWKAVSATALSRINSHRAAEQMIHVVIPSPVVSMYYRLSHQFQSSVGGSYSFFFYVHMFNWVSSFLDWINYANKCTYIFRWMIAWPALTSKSRIGGDSKVTGIWCQSLLITEVHIACQRMNINWVIFLQKITMALTFQ